MRGHLTLGEVGFGETMGQCRVGPCFFSCAVHQAKFFCLKEAMISDKIKILISPIYQSLPHIAVPCV